MILVFGRPEAWKERKATFELNEHASAVRLVRWISLLPPRARLDRNIVRMPDSHSRARVFSSFNPLLSFQPADVSQPDHTTMLQTAHLLASQSIWPSSISGSARQAEMQVCLRPGHTVSNSSIYFTCGRKELLQYSLLATTDIKVTKNTHDSLMFHCST